MSSKKIFEKYSSQKVLHWFAAPDPSGNLDYRHLNGSSAYTVPTARKFRNCDYIPYTAEENLSVSVKEGSGIKFYRKKNRGTSSIQLKILILQLTVYYCGSFFCCEVCSSYLVFTPLLLHLMCCSLLSLRCIGFCTF
jgi:hypothetical protein